MGPLLDTLYDDTMKKVHDYLGFSDPDQLVTMSMNGCIVAAHSNLL